jgi:hypothetical protein
MLGEGGTVWYSTYRTDRLHLFEKYTCWVRCFTWSQRVPACGHTSLSRYMSHAEFKFALQIFWQLITYSISSCTDYYVVTFHWDLITNSGCTSGNCAYDYWRSPPSFLTTKVYRYHYERLCKKVDDDIRIHLSIYIISRPRLWGGGWWKPGWKLWQIVVS